MFISKLINVIILLLNAEKSDGKPDKSDGKSPTERLHQRYHSFGKRMHQTDAEELLEILYYESLNIRGVIYPNKKRFMICLNPGWGSHEAWREEWKEGEKKVQGKAIEGFTVLWQNMLKIHLCKRNETTNLKFSSELLSELSNFVTIKQTFWRRIYLLTRQLSAEEISELEVDFEQEVKTLLQKLIKVEEVAVLWGLISTAEINVKIGRRNAFGI